MSCASHKCHSLATKVSQLGKRDFRVIAMNILQKNFIVNYETLIH